MSEHQGTVQRELMDGPPFFSPDRVLDYRRPPGTPYLLRGDSDLGRLVSDPALTKDWSAKQAQLMRWTRDEDMFKEVEVAYTHSMYDRYFAVRGLLTGCVVDVGGGWGLFRNWWSAEGGGSFVVHDPGAERFLAAPPPALQNLFRTGLARPVWFVEGYGEHLPYRDGVYDQAMIASALDHCADPALVMRECYRVLKIGGKLMIIQGFDPEEGEAKRAGTDLGSRLKRVLSDPRRLHRAIKQRVFHRGDPHIHHFSHSGLVELIENSGFTGVTETVLDTTHGVSVFEAVKPG